MADRHHLLKRQLKRCFGEGQDFSPEMQRFIAQVNDAYEQSELDRGKLENAMALSSQELLAANQELRNILEVIPDIFFHIDAGGVVLDFRVGQENAVRLQPEDVIGKHLRELPENELHDLLLQTIENGFRDEQLISMEVSMQTADGPQYFEARVLPLPNHEVIVMVRNITERKDAQRIIEQSHTLLEATFESTNNGILVVNREGKIVSYNLRFAEMWDISSELLDGGDDRAAMHHFLARLKNPGDFMQKIQELHTAPLLESRDELEMKDGRILERVSRPQVLNGEVIGRVWGFSDVTAYKKTEAAQRQQSHYLEQIINADPNLIFVQDAAGRFILVNQATADIINAQIGDLIGKSARDFSVGFTHSPEALEAHSRIVEGETSRLIIEQKIIDPATAEPRWFQVIRVPLVYRDGAPVQVLGVATEITASRQAAEKQEKLLREINLSNKELRNFVYLLSHDLKTPIRSIATLAEWILNDHADDLDEEGRGYLNLILERAMRMNQQMEGLLQYSQVGLVGNRREKADVNEIVQQAIAAMGDHDNVDLVVENRLPETSCDRMGLEVVFQCLMDNAIRFSDKPRVEIRVGCKAENGQWVFSVSDNGRGIEEKYHQKIFQLFQTLNGSDDDKSNGLGLTMVKKVVEIQGGDVWVESEIGKGSTFYFTIPHAG